MQRPHDITGGKCHKDHLCSCVQRKSCMCIPCDRESDLVKHADQCRVHDSVVIAQRIGANDLRILVDAVRRHDTGILIEEIGQPAQQADKRCHIGNPCIGVTRARERDARCRLQKPDGKIVVEDKKSCACKQQNACAEQSARHTA